MVGVEDQRRLDLAAQTIEQSAAEKGLARAHFPGNRDKAFPLLNPIQEMTKSFLVRWTEKQEAWVGRNTKGFFLEAKKGAVHRLIPGLPIQGPTHLPSVSSSALCDAHQRLKGCYPAIAT